MNEAAVKLLLQLKKEFLILKCKEVGIDHQGTKPQLAQRLAEYQDKEATRIWNAISKRRPNESTGYWRQKLE